MCVGVSVCVPTGVHPQSLDGSPLRAGQVPLLSVPSAGLAFNPAVSGALLTAGDLPWEPSDSPGAVGASVLKLSVSRPRCPLQHTSQTLSRRHLPPTPVASSAGPQHRRRAPQLRVTQVCLGLNDA